MNNIYYKYNFWDIAWAAVGVALLGAAIATMTAELFMICIPILLLSYKIFMQSRYIEDLNDEIDMLMEEATFKLPELSDEDKSNYLC